MNLPSRIFYLQFLWFFIPSTSQALTQYSAVDIGSFHGGEIQGYSINESGVIAGMGDNSNAFLYDGYLYGLGTLGGNSSVALGINNTNKIVGSSLLFGGYPRHAFMYDGSMHDLGTLGGNISEANAINNNGLVVGYAAVAGNDSAHAFLYDGTMHDLGTLSTRLNRNSTALDINNLGVIVGNSDTDDSGPHAFLYNGTMHDIGTLGGSSSYALKVNDMNQVVGYSGLGGGNWNTHAFIYDGSMRDLGTLEGGLYSVANGINNYGVVVGYSDTGNGENAFVYIDSQMLNLNDLVLNLNNIKLIGAYDINDSGQIVAFGSDRHTYLLSVISEVPVPATAWLMGTGLIGLTGIARRKK